MLAMSPLCPNLGWEYPIELLGTDKALLFDNFDFDSMFLANNNFSSSNNHQAQDYHDNNQEHEYDVDDDYDDDDKQQQQQQRSESPQGTISSSTDHHHHHHHQLGNNNNNNNNPASLSNKKINHNASERDRRKKINNMYSSLRALLPATDQRKKLSIPATVGRVLEYIPELQKEVDELTHKKQVFLSKLSALQGIACAGGFIQEQKPKHNYGLLKETTSCSISVNKLGDQEMVVQLSAFQRISLADVLLLLEKNGFLVIGVSSFQSFGGATFYNLHLWMEGRNNVDYEKLNEMLQSLLQKQKQMQMYSS